jgi:hypothetical protein
MPWKELVEVKLFTKFCPTVLFTCLPETSLCEFFSRVASAKYKLTSTGPKVYASRHVTLQLSCSIRYLLPPSLPLLFLCIAHDRHMIYSRNLHSIHCPINHDHPLLTLPEVSPPQSFVPLPFPPRQTIKHRCRGSIALIGPLELVVDSPRYSTPS